MSFGGPLFYLYWFGGICPCLEKDEDKGARQAMQYVNTAAARIRWVTSTSGRGSGGRRSSASEFIGSLFGSKKTSPIAGDDNDGSSSGGGGQDDVEARLVLRDNADASEPEVFVDPIPPPAAEGEAPPSQAVSYKLNIALRRVDRVTLVGDAVVLLAKPMEKDQPPKELLRFVALNADTGLPVNDEGRNMIVHHMAVLVEWERTRRRAAGFAEDDDNEEDQPNFLRARAQKAAHFAKREYELQQTRRDREKRKAKLVSESGGLKYTALAMANRD